MGVCHTAAKYMHAQPILPANVCTLNPLLTHVPYHNCTQVRPFTEKQLKSLISETGTIVDMWMPSIKVCVAVVVVCACVCACV